MLHAGARPKVITAATGLSASNVRDLRRSLGIAPFPRGRRYGDGDHAPRPRSRAPSGGASKTRDALSLLASGEDPREVAASLGISSGTVSRARHRWIDGAWRRPPPEAI